MDKSNSKLPFIGGREQDHLNFKINELPIFSKTFIKILNKINKYLHTHTHTHIEKLKSGLILHFENISPSHALVLDDLKI